MADRLTIEHYVGECFVKCAQIILGSRIYQHEQLKPRPDQRSARWFLLEVEELAGLSQRLEPWRRDVYAPLVLEIQVQPWDTSAVMPGTSAVGQPTTSPQSTGTTGSMLLERWTISYSPSSFSGGGTGSSSNSRPAMDNNSIYKRLILLVRSLYSYVRVLPAYRMFRACKRHRGEMFNTSYSITTTPLPLPHMQPPLTGPGPAGSASAGAGLRHGSGAAGVNGSAAGLGGGGGPGGGRMCHFAFSPVETASGAFCVEVEYQPATTVHFLEQTTMPPSMPRIISDYVDGAYARSAPNTAEGHRLMAAAAAGRHAGNSGSGSSRPEGTLLLRQHSAVAAAAGEPGTFSLLRSPQHRAPLVRHSWSSRDIAAPPVVQRGFNPAASSSAAATAAVQQGQQQHALQRSRSLTQSSLPGSSSSYSVAASAAGAGGSSPPLPVLFAGPSSLGRPPLPHSPASGPGQQQAGSSSSSSMGYTGLLPPASPGHAGGVGSSGSSRGLSLLRSTSAAAAGDGVPATAAAAAGGSSSSRLATSSTTSSLGSSPSAVATGGGVTVVQTVLGFANGQQRHKRVGQTAQVMGQGAVLVADSTPQARQQGFHVKQPAVSSSSSSSGSLPEAGLPATTTQQLPQQQQHHQQQQQQHHDQDCESATEQHQQLHGVQEAADLSGQRLDAAFAAAADDSSGGLLLPQPAAGGVADGADAGAGLPPAGVAAAAANSRAVSAPMMIPRRSKSRARSVTDLSLLDTESTTAGGGRTQLPAQQGGPAAAAAASGAAGAAATAAHHGMEGDAGGAAGAAAVPAAMAGRAGPRVFDDPLGVVGGTSSSSTALGGKNGSSSGLLGVCKNQQRQLVQAPSSAPAAPRGMLGQLLSASGLTSPSFSPPGQGQTTSGGGSSSSSAVRMSMAAAAAAAAQAAMPNIGGLGRAAAAAASPSRHHGDYDDADGADAAADAIISSTGCSPAAPMSVIAAAAASEGASPSYGHPPYATSARAIIIRQQQQQQLLPSSMVQYPAQQQQQQQQLGVTPGSSAGSVRPLNSRITPGLMGHASGQQQYQPHTPGSFLSSSPQLPFAFTPSAASLGASMMSFADQHGGGSGSSSKGGPVGGASPAVAHTASSRSLLPPASGHAASGRLPGGGGSGSNSATGTPTAAAAAAAGSAIAAAAAAGSSGVALVGTPSPPPHVSCIRDISGLATIRRPSWSSRSSSFDVTASSLPHQLSVSPMMHDLLVDPGLMGCSSSQGSHHGPGGGGVGTGSSGGRPGDLLMARMSSKALHQRAGSSGSRVLVPALVVPGGFEGQGGTSGDTGGTAGAARSCRQEDAKTDGGEAAEAGGVLAAADDTGQAAAAAAAAVGHLDGRGRDDRQQLVGEQDAGDAGDAEAAAGDAGAHGGLMLASARAEESESDILPFALDAEACPASHLLPAGAAAAAALPGGGPHRPLQQQQHSLQPQVVHHPQQQVAAVSGTAGSERDVAVGAFVRLLQEAASRQLQGRQQHMTLPAAAADLGGVGSPAGECSDVPQAKNDHHQQQQQQPVMTVNDAVLQVQELVAQLQLLVCAADP